MSGRVLALIPARGGSKGVPRKNLRLVAGRPLIAWTVAAARAAASVDRVILSTDDAEIAAAGREAGCDVPFVRPAALATDTADSLSVVRHALAQAGTGFDLLVLLQPTSPLRTAEDIDATVTLLRRSGAPTAVSVCVPDKSPWWMFTRDAAATLTPLLADRPIPDRRQDVQPVYALNGAVYAAPAPHLAAGSGFVVAGTVGHVMPGERSLDIDTELDLQIADLLLSARSRS